MAPSRKDGHRHGGRGHTSRRGLRPLLRMKAEMVLTRRPYRLEPCAGHHRRKPWVRKKGDQLLRAAWITRGTEDAGREHRDLLHLIGQRPHDVDAGDSL